MALKSDHLWQVNSEDEWRRFMLHDAKNPNRLKGYKPILEYLHTHAGIYRFAEFGCGGLHDFRRCFKRLQDIGRIEYSGIDLSLSLIEQARAHYPHYRFGQWDLRNPLPENFGITYIRHVFEHAAPDEWRVWLKHFLEATLQVGVIIWFLAPGVEHLTYPGAWNNCYDWKQVQELIHEAGFDCTIEQWTRSDACYVVSRVRG